MKNIIIIIISNLVFTLSVLATNPEYKTDNKTSNSYPSVKNKVAQKKDRVKKLPTKNANSAQDFHKWALLNNNRNGNGYPELAWFC